MKPIQLCQQCQQPLPENAPEGLCPTCLAKAALATETAPAATIDIALSARQTAKSELATRGVGRPPGLEPGQAFGGYRIVRLLGQGGMGTVYEAEDSASGRRVALKVLSHSLESASARQRFLREGRLAASINHPNSVYIYAAQEINGTPVITMEYVSGGTLHDFVKNGGPMPVAEAVDAAMQMIAGLEAAAAKGVLHRDVKPSNCFVENDGTIKIGDFGLSISTLARDQTRLTMTGAILGTPAYSSPEQLRGDELDVRSDIYSVGATLYFLLTGQTPFQADNVVNLIATVLEKPAPPPRLRRPKLSLTEDSIPRTGSASMVGPFHVLDSLAGEESDGILLGYDTRLLRRVWIHRQPPGTAPLPALRRNLNRKGRLHWLGSQRTPTECWDGYEAVAGQPLVKLVRDAQPWGAVRFWLCDLAEELDAALKDGSWPEGLGIDRVWITADGRAKLLDFPAPSPAFSRAETPAAPGPFMQSEACARRCLSELAWRALSGQRAIAAADVPGGPRVPLPWSARQFLLTLPGMAGLSTALDQIHPLLDKPAAVSRTRRLTLQAGAIAPILVLCAAFAVETLEEAVRLVKRAPDLPALGQCLKRWTVLETLAAAPIRSPEIAAKARQERDALEIYIADRFRSTITNSTIWTDEELDSLIPPSQRRLAERAVARHPSPSAQEVRQATATLGPPAASLSASSMTAAALDAVSRYLLTDTHWAGEKSAGVPPIVFISLVFVTGPSLLASLLLRRGLLLRLLRVEIVTGTGSRAGRWRAFLRSLLTWSPLLVLPICGIWVPIEWSYAPVLLVLVTAGAYSFARPDRGLQDRLAGTWLVPK